MDERFEISFSEGGVGALETIITGGLANAVEKGLDTITGNDDHGWYCTIEDSITELKVTCWGPTKEEAQEKALTYIWKDIEDFEYEQEKEEEREEERKRIQYEKEQSERRRFSNVSTSDNSSSSDVIIKIIAWIVGICLAVFVVIWLAINVVIPVAMLNSALIFAILTFVFKNKKTLFASLALVGGAYLIIDVTNGWLSLLFVENVVKSPYWISAFVYINAAAIGFCTWLLISPLWLKSNQLEPNNKRKNLILKSSLILIVAFAVAIAPIIYNSVKNPFNSPFNNSHYDETSMTNSTPQSKINKFVGTWTVDLYPIVEIKIIDNQIRIRECYRADTESGIEYWGSFENDVITAKGNPQDFYKFQLPTFKLLENGNLYFDCGAGPYELNKSNKKLTASRFDAPVNND